MQDNQDKQTPQSKRDGIIQALLTRLVQFNGETEPISWTDMKRQLKWMTKFGKPYKGRIGFLLGLSIFFMLLGVAYAYVYKFLADWIIGQVPNIISFAQQQFSNAMARGFWGTISWLAPMIPNWAIWIVVGYVLYKIVMFCWSLFMQFFTLRLSMDCGLGIKRLVFKAVLEADWMSLAEFHSGDLVNRIAGDADTISGFVLNTIPTLIVQCIQFVAASAMLIYFDWKLMLIALIGVPMSLFVIHVKAQRTRDYNKRSLELGSENSSFLNESMYNIMVIKSFMLVPEFLKRYRRIHDKMYDLTYERTRYGIVTGLMLGMVGRVVGYGITIFMLYRILEGQLTYGVLAAYSLLYGQVSGPLNAIMGFIMGAIEITASAERVMKLFDLPRDRTQTPEAVLQFQQLAKKQGGMGLVVDDLSFEYLEGKPVLQHANIEVNVGESVALVGPSGEGKTTMVRLMLGLLEPNSGKAYLTTPGGQSLALSVETREFFSYVPQGNTMFSGTIRDNMLLGDPDATDDQIIEALKQACAWDFIERSPNKLDSKLGERGLGLSEGQAQRLAIARALLRGAPILLLDEATSALDIYTEKAVLDNIFTDSKIKTVVLTTHRPSVFQICDKIYRIKQHQVDLVQSSREQAASF
ncbi:MAG: ABC transporter ATP-binding protein/permease [Oscillospiraceae bacterium]|jgi:ABC-type multidrug transport system fused ATPase/permease subunit|nr:ABC transporter ATP-binding protein/permease [Oscillospiraceae bacterium]